MIDTYRKIFDLLDKRERGRFVLLLLMILAMGLLDVIGVASILPFLTVLARPEAIHESAYLSGAFELFGFSNERAFLMFLGAAVFSLIVFGLGFKALTIYALIRFSTMRIYSLSSRLLHAYLSQPYVWFLNRHSADMGKTILSEVDHVINASIIPAMMLLAHSTVLLALIVLLFLVDPVVVTSAFLLLGVSYSLIFLAARRLVEQSGEQRIRANRERYQLTAEAIGGIKEVKLRGLEATFLKRFRAPAHAFAHALSVGSIIGQVPRFALEAIAFGGMLLLVLVLLAKGEGGVEALVPLIGLFAFAGIRMFPALQQVYHSTTQIRWGRPALEALHKDFCDAKNQPPCVDDSARLGLRCSLEVDDVYFRYPLSERNALNGLAFSIRANSTVGLVGSSGAGKTTVIDTLLGLLIPQRGVLRVDGADITHENRRAWQRSIGYVPQTIFLSDDTVSANIAFGIPPEDIDYSAVEKAARIAELHRFVIEELPSGYQTSVGERGVRLSGGQRQRIGIARALYHDPDVLIFDEATSALDNITERAVMDAIHNLSGAKTIIMVAHRLSTVERCDEIMVLDEGRVVAKGKYNELLTSCEQFRRMADALQTP